MKMLFVLRHAKSSWDDPQLSDIARPLAQSGRAGIDLVAGRAQQRRVSIDAIVSSSAERTRQTAALFAQYLKLPDSSISYRAELYFAGAPMLRHAVSRFEDGHSSVMLVGHNPAVTDFVNELGVQALGIEQLDNVPTCGLLQYELAIESWQEIGAARARLIEFDFPKREPDVNPVSHEN